MKATLSVHPCLKEAVSKQLLANCCPVPCAFYYTNNGFKLISIMYTPFYYGLLWPLSSHSER